jgi:hypothetical protein
LSDAKNPMTSEPHIAAHRHSSIHRPELLASDQCGCFYCLSTFNPGEIKDWLQDNGGQTALCPHCGIDSVIGSASGYPILLGFLQSMQSHWF